MGGSAHSSFAAGSVILGGLMIDLTLFINPIQIIVVLINSTKFLTFISILNSSLIYLIFNLLVFSMEIYMCII